MNLYATLNELHVESKISTALTSLTDAQKMRLLKLLNRASRKIDDHCRRTFYPRSTTNYFDYEGAWEIRFKAHELLEASTVTTAGGDTTVDSDDYDLLTGDVYGLYPKNRLLVHTDSGTTLDIGDRYEQANQITGIWGYHDDWDNAWLDSLDEVEDDPLSSSATTITVNDADGADADGVTPRFQVGQLIKIEDEYCYVSAVDATSNELTVARAQNGTTAASHDQDTTIYVYQPMAGITEACLLIATYIKAVPEKAPLGILQALEQKASMRLSIPKAALEFIDPHVKTSIGTARRRRHGGYGRLYPDGINPWRGR